MITEGYLKTIENDFSEKNPDFVLESWEDSHYHIPNIIKDKNYEIGVEIGVAFGSHSFEILKRTEIKKLYGIDPYKNYQEYDGDLMNMEQARMDDLFSFVEKRLSFYGDRFELIRDFSHLCQERFDDDSIDFAYIDGNHFEGYIKRDIDIWWKKIKPGGMLSGHDYNHTMFPHVTSEVDSFFLERKYSVNYLGNHVWCVFK
jgi:hypothetical protein